MTGTITRTRAFSKKKIADIREVLKESTPSEVIGIVFGSYARGEASEASDLDYIVTSQHKVSESDMEACRSSIGSVVSVEPARDGAFATHVDRGTIIPIPGGDDDTNSILTRRLLLLLESDWLFNEAGFRQLRRDLIAHYVAATPRHDQIAFFLLNDIIRYWRTITVDYRYKTGVAGKPWAIRNIKLVFSRKLIYAAGLFSVGLTHGKSEPDKVDQLEALFSLTPGERLEAICGRTAIADALQVYDRFLEAFEDESVRNHLKSLETGARDDPVFRDLRDKGNDFTVALRKAFEHTFVDHPIRNAVLF